MSAGKVYMNTGNGNDSMQESCDMKSPSPELPASRFENNKPATRTSHQPHSHSNSPASPTSSSSSLTPWDNAYSPGRLYPGSNPSSSGCAPPPSHRCHLPVPESAPGHSSAANRSSHNLDDYTPSSTVNSHARRTSDAPPRALEGPL